ncbi:MAG: hypothetical protein J5634_00105 [Bacilli bacterium]|nr:hypothetical protein [Bacilli bacterium]
MKKMMKVMAGMAGIATAGVIGYSLMNKKIRKKATELKDTMIEEAKDTLKK